METMELNMKDVAEPDQIASGTAVTGQENNAWRMLTRGFFAVHIGELDLAFCTTTRWVRRLRRQIRKLEERKRIQEAKRRAVRRVVWR